MSKHTPGPWKVAGESGNVGEAELIESEGSIIGWTANTVNPLGDDIITDEDRANGRLIAAAPAFKKALDMLLRATVDDDLKHGIGLTEAEQEARQFALDLFAYVEDGSGDPPWEPKSKEENSK